MYSGRLQLMIYRRLLCELLATNPPYDFTSLWEKLGLNSTAPFPTKFLVQAQLIQEDAGFHTTCLNDLVDLWHNAVKDSNIIGVDSNLELVYRLRPPDDQQNGKAASAIRKRQRRTNDEDVDLARAIDASLKDSRVGQDDGSEPSFTTAKRDIIIFEDAEMPNIQDQDPLLDSEDVQLQWALQQSVFQIPGTSDLRE